MKLGWAGVLAAVLAVSCWSIGPAGVAHAATSAPSVSELAYTAPSAPGSQTGCPYPPCGTTNVFVANPDGSGARQLAQDSANAAGD